LFIGHLKLVHIDLGIILGETTSLNCILIGLYCTNLAKRSHRR